MISDFIIFGLMLKMRDGELNNDELHLLKQLNKPEMADQINEAFNNLKEKVKDNNERH